MPHSSTAVHTLTIAPAVPLQAANAPPFWSTNVSVILPAALQLSVAVAWPVISGVVLSSQLIVISAGQVTSGAISSIIVIVC